MNNSPLLNIDHLRSFGAEPAYFGLGFIQLKIKQNSRVHFYHDDLPVLTEEPHDHRYRFISYILQGNFEQTLYQFSPSASGNYIMTQEDCKDNGLNNQSLVSGDLKELFSSEYKAGDYYTIEPEALHTVGARNNAITYLVRHDPIKEFAGVVRKIGAPKVCPFSQPIPTDQCWEMIEDMLPNSRPGYHLRDIKKGKIGEVSKIVEEAEELLDAHEQGVKVMELVELSDLYGAMVRYLEKHHTGMTMKDVKKMHKVTRRAFDNNRR